MQSRTKKGGVMLEWIGSLLMESWYWWTAGILFLAYYGIEVMINGGDSALDIPKALWNDFLWSIPGASKRRGAHIKEMMGEYEHGSMCATARSWSYREIREKDLYEEVGRAMLPSPGVFYGRLLAFACWPLTVVLLMSISIVTSSVPYQWWKNS